MALKPWEQGNQVQQDISAKLGFALESCSPLVACILNQLGFI